MHLSYTEKYRHITSDLRSRQCHVAKQPYSSQGQLLVCQGVAAVSLSLQFTEAEGVLSLKVALHGGSAHRKACTFTDKTRVRFELTLQVSKRLIIKRLRPRDHRRRLSSFSNRLKFRSVSRLLFSRFASVCIYVVFNCYLRHDVSGVSTCHCRCIARRSSTHLC